MPNYVIDASGNLLSRGPRTLNALLGSNLPQSILRDHAVNHEGFVLLDHDGHRTNIVMRTEKAGRLTLAELLYWLYGSATKSIILYDHMPDGHAPIVHSRERVIEWLQALLSSRRPCKDTFKSRAIHPECSILAHLARAFVEKIAQLRSVDAVEPICDDMFQRRYTISSFAGDGNTMVIRSLGHGYNSFDRRWADMARGCRPQDGPDYYYGLWVGETHRHALLTHRLLFDDVDAIIRRPQLPAMHVTYTRCVVPFRLRKGPSYVLSASAARDDIDLRR